MPLSSTGDKLPGCFGHCCSPGHSEQLEGDEAGASIALLQRGDEDALGFGLCRSVPTTVPWAPRHGEGLEPALLPALWGTGAAGVVTVVSHCWLAWHRTRDPWARLWDLLRSSPGHAGGSCTPAAPAACPAPSPGKRALPAAGEGSEQPLLPELGQQVLVPRLQG